MTYSGYVTVIHADRKMNARLELYKKYLRIRIEEKDRNSEAGGQNMIPEYINVENMYLEIMKTPSGQIPGFQLRTGNFLLQVECHDHDSGAAWVTHLTVYCVRLDIKANYKIGEALDKGGFAVVYLAKHLTTDMTVALKVVDRAKIKTPKNYVCKASFRHT